MAFDNSWEKIHTEMEWGKYPPEELIRLIMKKYKKLSREKRGNIKILEIGCGQGANMWFLAREGFDVYGIDGSESAIQKCKERFQNEGLNGQFTVGDFCNMKYKQKFDVIIDMVALCCCFKKDIEIAIKNIRNYLKQDGHFFSMTFQTGSYGYNLGIEIEKDTFKEITYGPLKGRGQAHFMSLDEVKELYNDFSNLNIEYKILSEDNMKNEVKYWIISATK